jgi:isopentenyldiphosphate isomerase
MITEETKRLIDEMDYKSMLSLWRNAPSGHPMFQGKVGDYYSEIMKKKREEVGNDEHVRASKNIGWGN